MKNPIFLCSRMEGALSGWMELWTTVAPISLPLRTHSLRRRYPISFLRKYGWTPMFSTHSRLSSSQMWWSICAKMNPTISPSSSATKLSPLSR